MKKLNINIIILVLSLFMANVTSALMTVNFQKGSGRNGEFIATTSGTLDSGEYAGIDFGIQRTFCIERHEMLNYTATFTVYDIGDTAYNGGQVTPVGACLYSAFYDGTLPGYVGSDYQANSLQNAIWYAEDEVSTPLQGLAATYYNYAYDAVDTGTWSGIGNVRAMNIKWPDGQLAQSQLVMAPYIEGSTAIPAPGAAILGSIGVCLVGLLHNKKEL